MENLIYELETALDNGAYIISLNIALTVPDICAALQSESGKTTGKKYSNWFNKYVAHQYNDFINGEDIYKIRCAALHQGKLNNDNNPKFRKIIFQIPTPNGNIFHNNILGDSINLNIEIFIRDIIKGFEQWRKEHEGNPIVDKNQKESINFYPNGLKGYMIGMPLMC